MGAAFFCLGLSTVLAWERSQYASRGPVVSSGGPWSRVIGDDLRVARRTRSAGASSTWSPRRPADTRTVACSIARASTTTGSGRRGAERADATDHIAGRAFRLGRVGHRRPPAADRVGQALQVELAVDRDDGEDQPAVDRTASVLNTPAGSIPRATAASVP